MDKLVQAMTRRVVSPLASRFSPPSFSFSNHLSAPHLCAPQQPYVRAYLTYPAANLKPQVPVPASPSNLLRRTTGAPSSSSASSRQPVRCFAFQPEDERGYIPLRNSMAKQLNLKPIEIPYPNMFRKRHKRMLQRLEFTRLEAAIRKKQTKEARERKLEKRREKWRAAVERKKDWEDYLKSKQDSIE